MDNKPKKTWEERIVDSIIILFFFGLVVTAFDLIGIRLDWAGGLALSIFALLAFVLTALIGGIVMPSACGGRQMAEQKTIGEIAYEGSGLGDHIPSPYKSLLPFSKCNWEAAASAVWNEAVEACIGIAKNKAAEISADEKLADGHMYAATCFDMVAGIESILEGLRDLKRSPSRTEETDV